MSALNRPKRFEVQLYVNHSRFKDDTWKKDVGEELYTLGKQLMQEPAVIPSRILDHGGTVGEIIIDYPEDDEGEEPPQGIMGKPHKADISICLGNAEFDGSWEDQLAETVILLGNIIKATDKVPETVQDYNGNTIGSVTITP